MYKNTTGWWIRSDGSVLECDWKHDHEFILSMYFDTYQEAFRAGWIRVTMLEGLAVDYPLRSTISGTMTLIEKLKDCITHRSFSHVWVSITDTAPEDDKNYPILEAIKLFSRMTFV